VSAEEHAPGVGGFRLIPTYDLRRASYTSPHVHFSSKEIHDKDFKPLERLEPDEQAIVDGFNKDARWPFLFINGQYVQFGSGFSPSLVDGLDFETLRQQLSSGVDNDATRAIRAEADLIARYICHGTGGQPASACGVR
jgi:hypothetical protein